MREPDERFTAPWSPLLWATSALFMAILIGAAVVVVRVPPPVDDVVWYFVVVGPFAVGLVAAPPFAIRGFVLRDDELVVERLGWVTRIPLMSLTDAVVDAQATRRAWRTFGNGGAFAFTGWYRSKGLGDFRLFGTDLKRAVVLRFADRKPIVVTPGDPEAFAEAARRRIRS